jgi:hypothetical protein
MALTFYELNIQDYNYSLTIGPSQTQLYIGTQATAYSIGIFLGGALFSAGFAMMFSLLQPAPPKPGKKSS